MKSIPDILPVYPDSHDFVMEQRRAQFADLKHAVEVMDLAETDAPCKTVLFAMWLLETEQRKPPLFPETYFSVSIYTFSFNFTVLFSNKISKITHRV